MKRYLYLSVLACLFVAPFCSAQNLVPNPSFENYSLCPNYWAQIDRVDNWETYKGSPDYFNSCTTSNFFSTPQNQMGFQLPSSGNAYIGNIFFSRGNLNADEMIGVQLNQPLTIGTKYFISFKVVLKYNNPHGICCANNKIGARFSTQSFSQSTPPSSNNFAHVWTDSVISDTLNWTNIFGTFTADSSYNYLIIGNFFTPSNINIIDFTPTINDYSYYFLDDVCVSTDSNYCYNYTHTEKIDNNKKHSSYTIYPNPTSSFIYIKKNTLKPYNLTIHNEVGQKVYQKQNISENKHRVNVSRFPCSIFFIRISCENKKYYYKILKL